MTLRDAIFILLGIGIVIATEAAWVLWNSARFVQRVLRIRRMTWVCAYWFGIAFVVLVAVLVLAAIGFAIGYALR